MKKSILALLLMVFALTLFAQRGPEHKPKGERLAQELQLTPQQKDQMKLIRENHRNEFRAIKESDVSKEERKAGMNALHESIKHDLEGVLSPEQMTKWNEIHTKKKAKGRQMRQEKRAVMKAMNLTDEQKERLKNLRMENKASFKSIKEADLPDEEKRARAKELRKAIEVETREILTPQQFELWRELPNNRPRRAKQFNK